MGRCCPQNGKKSRTTTPKGPARLRLSARARRYDSTHAGRATVKRDWIQLTAGSGGGGVTPSVFQDSPGAIMTMRSDNRLWVRLLDGDMLIGISAMSTRRG